MSIDFDVVPDRRSTESIKWHFFEPDVLPMWVADMDFKSPEPVIEALKSRIDHGVFGYPVEMTALKEVIVERLANRYQWKVTTEDIVLVPGVVTGFNLICHALASPGEAALIQTPVYPPFFKAPPNAGLECQEAMLALQPDGSYEIDYEVFEASITKETRLFILCNPHNPVGRVFRQDELERMADICLKHGVKICADEIHSDLVFSGQRHIPMASLDSEIARSTVTLIAPSKTFNIAGLECSIAIIEDKELRKRILDARQGMVGSINVLGQVAGLAAYRYGQPWLDELLVYLEGNRDYLYNFVQNKLPEIKMAKPEGTYLAWLDCRKLDFKESPCEYYIKNARVGMNDGREFGACGEGFVRLNFGCPRSMLKEALDRIYRATPD
jgi:cystathionine beta-lyase